MSTVTIPPNLTSLRDDAVQLHHAFEELHGKTETAILLWMHDLPGRDAIIVKQALSSDTLNLEAATEVICSRTPYQIYTFKQHYFGKFGSYLEHDIEHRASGDHKKLLLAYASIPRSEGLEVNPEMAAADANALYKAGEKRFGTDEKTFIQIFSERSNAQLAAAAAAYRQAHGRSLAKAIKKETSGLFEFALLSILRCSQNPAKYFAKRIFLDSPLSPTKMPQTVAAQVDERSGNKRHCTYKVNRDKD
ncbi:hypothetical protein ACFE04_026296 [Oxalis oulophora]